MNSKCFAVVIVLLAIGTTVHADDDDYFYMAVCDSRCDVGNRLTPFAESCDDCCRMRGFRKGKCGGFGWQYCKCKRMSQLRNLFNAILNNH
ncbi:hypothetical protein Ocin01_02720 [Orchesella cincta]|uniref:Uncharacterized protein n=1 Tax=Orchesella cincta TaxID=48709 RepID=A0A1D2NFE6_ORCCI|nr:hypothetical protein Ocin01_02720 [Orchesella cincta]